jgi:transposase
MVDEEMGMPAKRELSMRQLRHLLRLHHGGVSAREIGRRLGVARSTVQDNLKRAAAAGLAWPLADDVTDDALELRLFGRAGVETGQRRRIEPDWAALARELKRAGVTMMILWEEYREINQEGYGYSRFCDLLRGVERRLSPVMRQHHVAGEKAFVDYSGKRIAIVDPTTGEIHEAEIFVGVLGASNLTYAEATWTQQLPDWTGAHVRMFRFFGGVPKLLVPDNLKSGVVKASFYDPEINRTYGAMAAHYSVGILPARPYKPRDKATVSFCTLFGGWLHNRREAGGTTTPPTAPFDNSVARRQFPETSVQAVGIAPFEETLAPPSVDSGFGHVKSQRDFAGREQPTAAKSFVAARQFVCCANEGDFLQVEWLALPGLSPATVEDLGDLAVAMEVEELIHLGDQISFELADLSYRQRPVQDELACGAPRKSNARGDLLRLRQRHVLDKETQNAFALAGGNARILPDFGESRGQVDNLSARRFVQNHRLFLGAFFVVGRSFAMEPQLIVPFRFECIGDEAIVGIHFHVASTSQFGFVARPLDMLPPEGVSLGDPRFEFALDGQHDL